MGVGTRLLAKTTRLFLVTTFLNNYWGRGPVAADEISDAEAGECNEEN